MKRYFLSQIEIEGFRGINNEHSPLRIKLAHNKICSIFAPNASGKSSIFDALCFSFKQEIPRFKNIQQKENPAEYYVNHFHSTGKSNISLNLISDDNSEEATILIQKDRSGECIITSPNYSNPEELLLSLNHDGLLIDYDNFRSFIENKPLERGRAFSALIGLSKISSLKQSIDTLANTRNINTDFNYDALTAKRSNKQKEYLETRDNILELLKSLELADTDLSDIPKLEQRAISILRNITLFKDILTEDEFKAIDFNNLINILRETEGSKLQTEFITKDNFRRELEKVIAVNEEFEKEQLDKLAFLIKEREELLEATLGSNYNSLYKAAKSIYEELNYPTTSCPLCESTNLTYSDVPLYNVVINKLESFDKINEANAEIKRVWNSYAGRSRFQRIETMLHEHSTNIISECDTIINSEGLNGALFKSLTQRLKAADNLVIEKQKQLNEEITKIKDRLPASITDTFQKIRDVQKLAESISHLAKIRDDGLELKRQCEHIERWQEYISNLSTSITKAETALSQTVCSEIEENTRSFFKKIVNNDSVVPSLKRATNKQDLDLVLNSFFSTADLYASPLLSESYRNAFAISVYLASLIRSKPKARFLLLDDITSSFDAGNQLSLIELLFSDISTANNQSGLQIIILSHDGLLKKYFNTQASNSSDKWQHFELAGLAPEGRVTINQSSNNDLRDTIIMNLQAGHVNIASPLIRQYLELKVLEVIKRLDIPVSLTMASREDARMVNDCLKAVKSHIELTTLAGVCILEPNQSNSLQNTVIPQIFGNYLSHIETNSIMSISANSLLGIMNKIDDFNDHFKYSSPNGQRTYYKSLTQR